VVSSNGHATPLIRAEGIWKIFGKNADKVLGTSDLELTRAELREKTGCVAAVRDVSFDVYPGQVFVVMGLSGSGKSTLVRTLIRLIEPTAGRVEIDGHDVTAANRDELLQLRRHTASMVFQHFGLLAHRTVLDNVAFGLEVQGVPKAERHARASEVLTLVGLEDAAGQFPDELSGGMQQRVGLARAFAVDPKVMLYDEPFSALDPLIRRDMQDEVCRLQEETGTPEELVGSPADEYVANFVRDIPRSHVLTLRWIMRDAQPGEEDGPKLDVGTTVKKAVPVISSSEQPVCAVENGKVVGVVDKTAALAAIAGEGD
jgi:glycine betaine/proline transport system ATP-binding protein